MRNKKIILIGLGLLIVLGSFAVVGGNIHADPVLTFSTKPLKPMSGGIADFVGGLALWPLQAVIMLILVAVNALLGLLLYLFNLALFFFIDLGVHILGYPAVAKGFAVTLGITNLIFVLAIIIIAFATIFRWESYSAKKMLPKLIIAALLVNFSFLIAGLLLDIGNVFTQYFVDQITAPGARGVILHKADAIGQALQPQIAGGNASTTLGDLTNGSNKFGLNTASDFVLLLQREIFGVVITFVAMVVMAATAIMALIRNLWIVALVITMPIVWGLWLIPKFEHYWKEWWTHFLNWGLIYLPTVTFFLALAVSTAGSVPVPGIGNAGGINPPLGFLDALANEIIKFLLVVGLMIAGLKIAKKMGAAGATFGLAVVSSAGRWAGGRALRLGRVTTGAAVGTIAAAGMVGTGRMKEGYKGAYSVIAAPGLAKSKAASLGSRILNSKVLGWVPGLAGAANTLAGPASPEGRLKVITQRDLSNLNRNELTQRLQRTAIRDPYELTAQAEEAAKRGLLHKIKEEDVQKYVDAAKSVYNNTDPDRVGILQALSNHHPDKAMAISGEQPATVIRRTDGKSMEHADREVVMNHINDYGDGQIGRFSSVSVDNELDARTALVRELVKNTAALDHLKQAGFADPEKTVNDLHNNLAKAIADNKGAEISRLRGVQKQLADAMAAHVAKLKATKGAVAKLAPEEQIQIKKWLTIDRMPGGSAHQVEHASHVGHEHKVGPIRQAIKEEIKNVFPGSGGAKPSSH